MGFLVKTNRFLDFRRVAGIKVPGRGARLEMFQKDPGADYCHWTMHFNPCRGGKWQEYYFFKASHRITPASLPAANT